MSDKFSFSRKKRLLKKTRFREILIYKKFIPGKYYTLYYQVNNLAHPRLGVVAARKNCHLATGRNRLKRQARESFRHHQLQLPHYDIVAITRHPAEKANNLELRQCLDNLFLKLISVSTG